MRARGGKTAALVSAAVMALAVSAPFRASAYTPAQVTRFQEAIHKALLLGEYPGLLVGVWGPHGNTFVKGYGTAREGVPIRAGDHFRIGSITKTMTATVVLRLVEEGKLSLNEPLSTWYPGILHAPEITLRQLLNHTSLIPDNAPETVESLLRVPSQVFDPAEVIGAALTQEFAKPPWYYSDVNYVLLGQIIRKVTRLSVARALQRYVLAPLHLRQTSLDPGPVVPLPAANGFRKVKGETVNVSHWTTSYDTAAGAVVSTLGDLHRWARALAAGTLLSKKLQQERLEWVQTGKPGLEYGLGIARFYGNLIGHDGAVFGYESMMVYAPTLRTTIVVLGTTCPLVNDPPGETYTVAIAEAIAKILEGSTGAALPPPPAAIK
jgi:D-alanyl-D-alanine carboxypeptidase